MTASRSKGVLNPVIVAAIIEKDHQAATAVPIVLAVILRTLLISYLHDSAR